MKQTGDRYFEYAERYGGAAMALFVLAVYVTTLAPGVTFWDSGELILGGLTLGIPHPPGSPAYCILGKAFSFIPIGSGAFSINVMSAVFGALAAYAVYALTVRLSDGGPLGTALGLAAGLLFGLTGPAWSVSVVAEVYTLACLLMLLVALLVVMHRDGGGVRCLYAAAFVLGLSVATHQSAVFIIPAFVLYALYGGKLHMRPASALVTAGFALLGFSSVIYLAVRAGAGPVLDIGSPDNVYRMAWVLKLSEDVKILENLASKLPMLIKIAGTGYVIAAIAAFAVLLFALRRDRAGLFMLVGAAVTFGSVVLLTVGASGLAKWGQTGKFYVLGMTYGLPLGAYLLSRLAGGTVSRGARAAAGIAGLAAVLLMSVWLVHSGYAANDRTDDRYARTFATDTLKSVSEDAVLVGWGDNGTFPVWYIWDWERYRDDVLFIHGELLSYGWYADEMARRVRLRYGVDFVPGAELTDVKATVERLRRALRGRERVYLDFSAVYQLGYDWGRFEPQGLAYLDKGARPRPQGLIWDKMGMVPLIESGADPRFATEGVLDIYGYQCFLWGARACYEGRTDEANGAFGEAEVLAPGSFTAKCGPGGKIEKLGSSFRRGRKKARRNGG